MKSHIRPDSHSKEFRKIVQDAVIDTNNRYAIDFDSVILWTLHNEFGFGKDRLYKFYHSVKTMVDDLNGYYEMPKENGWICRNKLFDMGIDLEKWQEELLNEK